MRLNARDGFLQRDAVRDKDRREILGNRVRVEISNANK
jgi:hypothetical protein